MHIGLCAWSSRSGSHLRLCSTLPAFERNMFLAQCKVANIMWFHSLCMLGLIFHTGHANQFLETWPGWRVHIDTLFYGHYIPFPSLLFPQGQKISSVLEKKNPFGILCLSLFLVIFTNNTVCYLLSKVQNHEQEWLPFQGNTSVYGSMCWLSTGARWLLFSYLYLEMNIQGISSLLSYYLLQLCRQKKKITVSLYKVKYERYRVSWGTCYYR